MQHIKEAWSFWDQGDSKQAFEIIENILSFSPSNPEALRLKARILDHWGHFDEAFDLLKTQAKVSSSDQSAREDFENILEEEKTSLLFSQMTTLGRWYFPFSALQIFFSMMVFIGGLFFLVSAPRVLSFSHGGVWLGLSFFALVFTPWFVSIVLGFRGVKKIFVGLDGISVFYGFKSVFYSWQDLGPAIIEYDPHSRSQYLRFILCSKETREPLLNFDISQSNSVVRARRHFVRLVSSYLDSVSYVPRVSKVSQSNYFLKNLSPLIVKSRNDKAA